MHASVAQLDRASDSDSEGRRFDSCRAHHIAKALAFKLGLFLFPSLLSYNALAGTHTKKKMQRGNTMAKKKTHYAWLILLGVILVRGFAGGGLNTTSALFLSPVSEELQVGIGNLSIYFSITSIVMVLWLPFAGKLINRYDIRSMAILGAALQALSFAAFGFLRSVYGWYLLAIPYAMGATLLINLLGPILINRWFARNTGLMLGIQMAFVGLFGAVFQPLTSNLIAKNGWRFGYFTLGGITFLAVFLTALFLLRNKPGDKGLKPYGCLLYTS